MYSLLKILFCIHVCSLCILFFPRESFQNLLSVEQKITSNFLLPDATKHINACVPSVILQFKRPGTSYCTLHTDFCLAEETQVDMSNVSFLDFLYEILKSKFLQKSSWLFSSQDRQNSGLLPTFMPNRNEMKNVLENFDSNEDVKIYQMEYKAILKLLGRET